MRILVPGHRGYIGQVLTPLLMAEGHEVVGLDSGYYGGGSSSPSPGSLIFPSTCETLRPAISLVSML